MAIAIDTVGAFEKKISRIVQKKYTDCLNL